MCGIVGFNFEDEQLAKELGELLKHRGPDGEGYYKDNGVTLGHRRLSIVDLSDKGSQPMTNEDGTVWLTYNGEIYNFEGIKEDLLAEGHDFTSETDSEVLIHGYEEYGSDLLEKLNGQFAFCIYDKQERKLFLARDRIGINPLYYYWDENKFIFGSELKVILESGVDKEINQEALNHYLSYGYTPRGLSIIENGFKLNPGCYIEFDLDNQELSEQKKFWSLEKDIKIKDEEVAKKAIRRKLKDSVDKRMMADVPVGAFLSGGIDSSTISSMMKQHTDDLKTFSVKFDYEDYDESHYSNYVADKINSDHKVINFSGKDVKKLIELLPHHYDEPFADHSMIPTYLVSNVASEEVTVCLSGDGADELFAGYGKYKLMKVVNWQNNILKPVFKLFSYLPLPGKIKRYFLYSRYEAYQQYANLNSYKYIEDISSEDLEVYERYEEYFEDDIIQDMTESDSLNYLPEDILTKLDRASLGNGLEARTPFLDHDMIELAFSIKSDMKMKWFNTKYILKKAVKGIIPSKIIERKKEGFGSPIKYYLKTELKPLVKKYVIDYDKHSHFDNINKKELYEDHLEGVRDNSRLLFSILMFNLWWEEWM